MTIRSCNNTIIGLHMIADVCLFVSVDCTTDTTSGNYLPAVI